MGPRKPERVTLVACGGPDVGRGTRERSAALFQAHPEWQWGVGEVAGFGAHFQGKPVGFLS